MNHCVNFDVKVDHTPIALLPIDPAMFLTSYFSYPLVIF